MAVYVDELFPTTPKPNWPYTQACHMTADTLEELHDFAQNQLGLKRAWYQHHATNLAACHYDLTVNMRRKAIRLGAVALTFQQAGDRLLAARKPQTVVPSARGRLVPFGYADGGSLSLERLMALEGAFLVDIRLVPYGWEWFNKERLQARWPSRYVHIPELGNEHYNRPELGIKMVDLSRGLARLIKGIQQRRTLIVMCGCRDYQSCHRKVVVEELLKVMPEALVVMPDVAAPSNSIKGISINQPWGYLVANGHKPIENRPWHPGDYRGPVLIHVGLKIDGDCFTAQGELDDDFADYVEHACGWTQMPSWRSLYAVKALIGVVDLVDVVRSHDSPWFNGPYGWIFENAKPFDKPIPYGGMPNLFDVPMAVVEEAMANI